MDKKLVLKIEKPKGEGWYKTFSVRAREDIIDKIEVLADKTNRTRNELINVLLDFALANCVVEEE